jgi:hypothetical protein
MSSICSENHTDSITFDSIKLMIIMITKQPEYGALYMVYIRIMRYKGAVFISITTKFHSGRHGLMDFVQCSELLIVSIDVSEIGSMTVSGERIEPPLRLSPIERNNLNRRP